jgi:hypothetical protein
VSRPICEATRKDGQPCQAASLPGSGWCWSHDPAQQEIAAEARRDGARKGNKLRALHGRRRRLDSHAGLSLFLHNLIHDLAEGKQDPDVARVIVYACSVMRQLNEHSLERRLADVERLLASVGQRRA